MTLEEIHIDKVPSVPQILLELLRLCHKPVVEFGELAKVIEQDPVTCAKILHTANTVFYRQWSEVTHVRRLLVVLGLDTVKQIAVTSAVHQYFSRFSPDNDHVITAIWLRSLLCAYIAQDLARLTGCRFEDEAYTAGLLHRIGQLVLLQNFPERYLDVLFMDETDGGKEHTERELFNASYCEVGATLLRHWPLHPFTADAVRFQNVPQNGLGDASALVKVLNLANRLTHQVFAASDKAPVINDELFGLNISLLGEVSTRARRIVIEGARLFGIHAEGYLDCDKGVDKLEEASANRLARRHIGNYVHHAALVGSLQTFEAAAPDQHVALQRIRQDLGIVFGLHEIGFLLSDAQSRFLAGQPGESGPKSLAEVSISLSGSSSLAVRALREAQLQCSLQAQKDEPASIIDQQLSHLYACDGVVFIPLLDEGRILGVAVAGISSGHWTRLAAQRELLNLFARQLSRYFGHSLQMREGVARRQDEQREWQRLELLKHIHEANNPLSIINNYLYALSMKLGEQSPASEDITIIKEEIARVGEILARMKNLGGQDLAEEQGLVHLNRIIRDLLKLFEGTLLERGRIETHLDLDDEIPPLRLSSGAIKQVLMNLVKNAAEAITEQGTLHIATRDRIYKNGRQFVELQIADTGPGLPAAVLNGLFRPVVSHKKDHSGLGLVVVKNLLDQMSAEISCSSSSAGTRFQILLPRILPESD